MVFDPIYVGMEIGMFIQLRSNIFHGTGSFLFDTKTDSKYIAKGLFFMRTRTKAWRKDVERCTIRFDISLLHI